MRYNEGIGLYLTTNDKSMRIFEHIKCSSSGKRMRVREMEKRGQDMGGGGGEEGEDEGGNKQGNNQGVTMMRGRERG